MSTPRLQNGRPHPYSLDDNTSLNQSRAHTGFESYNLKINFLHGISLRNLNLEQAGELETTRPTNLAIVDENDESPDTSNVSSELESHSDQVARSQHSDSANSTNSAIGRIRAQSNSSSAHKRPKPQFRRQSTLNWAEKTQTEKEELILEAVQYRTLDVFVSLHDVKNPSDPLYISEIATRVNNVDFQRLDLDLPASVALSSELWICVWARVPGADKWQALKVLKPRLHELCFVAQDLEDFDGQLSENSILLHLRNGIYTASDGLTRSLEKDSIHPQPALRTELPTSRYDDFLHLQNLVECIADNVATIRSVRSNIDNLLGNGQARQLKMQLSESLAQVSRINNDLHSLRVLLVAQKKTQESQSMQLASRKQKLSEGTRSLTLPSTSQKEALSSIRQQHDKRLQNIALQRSKLAQELQFMFPLDTVPDKPFLFTIAGLRLPSAASFESSTFSAQEDHEHASALGLVVLLTLRLETYLSAPLPYLATYMGSSSEIYDPLTPASDLGTAAASHPAEVQTTSPAFLSDIANVNPHRRFPLYAKGVQAKRFKMGVYLLNRNVEELMNKMSLKAVDVRHTLANLKYLLVVLSNQT